ncbi:IucA/IucC family siderophore biosynthesis protein [Paenibacillus sp. FJAT-26967]|uniref:IucA/IucC family protein n=1 Tax=Paenibacillus sp. FJAT-26967 TaxID=1729690 RepID=UPI0008386E0E|nr:IucA/IucC family protein [Paenibacillus sp. FJAT-26967]
MNRISQDMRVSEAIASPQYAQVLSRVFRQLIESLLYEEVIEAQTQQKGDVTLYTLRGTDSRGRPCFYTCCGKRRLSFGRIRLTEAPVIRQSAEGRGEASSVALFMREVVKPDRSSSGMEPDEQKLEAFIEELEETVLKDTLSQYERANSGVQNANNNAQSGTQNSVQSAEHGSLQGKGYDALESGLTDGHPYHPSYKSRIGFDYADHMAYGPEYKKPLRLLWVAVSRENTRAAISSGSDFGGLLAAELGEAELARLNAAVRAAGCDPRHYHFVPVHPWQWKKKIAPAYMAHLRDRRMILLGESPDEYLPQQSIRTMANRSRIAKASLKLAMNLLNTSSSRHLPPHFVTTAPMVSDWLNGLVEGDDYLKNEAKLILLREFAGISYDPPAADDPRAEGAAGSLGCIWRESIHRHLEKGEEAVPFNALCALELDGTPYILPWLQSIGIESWLRRLFETSVLPIVHLLVAHGVSLETHAQNMVLVHRDGMPVRVALKDFHEDVLFCREYLAQPEKCPDFTQAHEIYEGAPLGTYFEMADVASVRSLTLGALFFINLGELALLLADRCGYEETRFWELAAQVLGEYERRFPQLAERYRQADLFVPTCRVEQLTKRRLYPQRDSLTHEVPNPLFAVTRQLEKSGQA